jgi:antitoxin component YwqK of YwqJK toxin-antitoxin module
MRSKLVLFFSLFAILSCQPNIIRKVNDTYENGNPKAVYYYSAIAQTQLLKKELFYESGKIKLKGFYKNNLKNGQWLYYHENGNISDECWFYKGQLHGRSSSSYANGKLRSSGYYHNGERIREWIFFDEEGRLINRIYFNSNSNQTGK